MRVSILLVMMAITLSLAACGKPQPGPKGIRDRPASLDRKVNAVKLDRPDHRDRPDRQVLRAARPKYECFGKTATIGPAPRPATKMKSW